MVVTANMDDRLQSVKFASTEQDDTTSQWESKDFEKSKKQGPFKKNLAQSRLERIRSNFNMQKKMKGKLEKFSTEEPISHCNVTHKTNILMEKFMPDRALFSVDEKSTLESKVKRYSADKRLEKARKAVRKKAVEFSSNNNSGEPTRSSSNRSVLKRILQDETTKPNLSTDAAQSKRDSDGKSEQHLSGHPVNRSTKSNEAIIAVDKSSGKSKRRTSKHLVSRSSLPDSVHPHISKIIPETEVSNVGEKPASRNLKRCSADGRLEKARKKLMLTSPKKLSDHSSKILSNRSVMKRFEIAESVKPKQPMNNAQTGEINDERLKETQMTVINSEISPRKLIHDFVENSADHSVLKRAPKRIVNSEPWTNRSPETRDSSDTFGARTDEIIAVDDMSMDVDVECVKTDEPVASSVLSSERFSTPQFTESTDWEETSSCVTFMNDEIHKLRQEPMYMALHENFMPDVDMNLALPSGDILIVIDTNIFFSYLSFIRRLLTCKISTYQSPVLVVAWPVLQEIDYAMKKNNPRLSAQAKAANTFVFDCLKNRHPRIFGQSMADFKDNFKNAVSIDDFILQYCLTFVASRNNVILLTDDKNLHSKCMVSHVPVFTKKEFEKTFDLV